MTRSGDGQLRCKLCPPDARNQPMLRCSQIPIHRCRKPFRAESYREPARKRLAVADGQTVLLTVTMFVQRSLIACTPRQKLTPGLRSRAEAFCPGPRAEHMMAQTDCRHFPTKRQMGICKMAVRSILTPSIDNISYLISAKSSSTRFGSPPSERIISL
jgi:hypothetical protein